MVQSWSGIVVLISSIFLSFDQAQAGLSRRHTHVRRGGYDSGDSLVDTSDEDKHREEFFHFVTVSVAYSQSQCSVSDAVQLLTQTCSSQRPDIDAPRWNVKVYDEPAVTPGYWFVASYEYIHQSKPKDRNAWIGPHIYDGSGELVWSGAPLFKGYNFKDFRVSSINGEPMLTGVYEHDHVDIVIDNTYRIVEKSAPEEDPVRVNIHDFNTVDDGTRALAMTHYDAKAEQDEADDVGLNVECRVDWIGFEEYDTTTWERTFSWNSKGHVHLSEGYNQRHTCKVHWDYL